MQLSTRGELTWARVVHMPLFMKNSPSRSRDKPDSREPEAWHATRRWGRGEDRGKEGQQDDSDRNDASGEGEDVPRLQ